MTTPNMTLDLPAVQVTLGPQWASLINSAFEVIDTHDHTSTKGVQVPTAGININADLNFNGNNAYALRTVRLSNLGVSPAGVTDLGIVYQKNGELAYKDASGNEVVITAAGSVAGATGTITGLSSPASAAFSSVTNSFTFSFDSSKPGKVNASDYSFYEYNNASANAITLKSPASVGAAYTIALPTAQATQSVELLTIDNNGQMNHAQLSGTANQVNVTQSTSAVQLALPQDIHSGASPSFTGALLGDGVVGTPALRFTNDTNTGLYRVGADQVALVAGGTTRVTANTTGAAVNGALTATSINTSSGGALKMQVYTGTFTGTSTSFTHGLTVTAIVGMFGGIYLPGNTAFYAAVGEKFTNDYTPTVVLKNSNDSITIETAYSSGISKNYKVVIFYQ